MENPQIILEDFEEEKQRALGDHDGLDDSSAGVPEMDSA